MSLPDGRARAVLELVTAPVDPMPPPVALDYFRDLTGSDDIGALVAELRGVLANDLNALRNALPPDVGRQWDWTPTQAINVIRCWSTGAHEGAEDPDRGIQRALIRIRSVMGVQNDHRSHKEQLCAWEPWCAALERAYDLCLEFHRLLPAEDPVDERAQAR